MFTNRRQIEETFILTWLKFFIPNPYNSAEYEINPLAFEMQIFRDSGIHHKKRLQLSLSDLAANNVLFFLQVILFFLEEIFSVI